MGSYILPLHDIDKTQLGLVGGKGANLGELCGIDGIQVPDGFCVTTDVYRELVADNKEINALLDQLAVLKADGRKAIGEVGSKIRKAIEEIRIPDHIVTEITF